MVNPKLALRRQIEKYPHLFNPIWKIYYRYRKTPLDYDGRTDAHRKEAFEQIYKENFWGSDESVSGPGSTLQYTQVLRRELPKLFSDLGIRKVLDAPCGDFNWMRAVPLGDIQYIGCDIVEDLIQDLSTKYADDRHEFAVLDIVEDKIPSADIWMCREVLFHLSNRDCLGVFHRFLESDVKYILTTTFDISKKNVDIRPGGFRHINLRAAPFNLPKPLRSIDDFVAPYAPRSLGLWSKRQVKDALGS